MSVSSVQSPALSLLKTQQAPQAGRAPDGDSAAVEAAESAATKRAEKLNGGFAPSHSASKVNKKA